MIALSRGGYPVSAIQTRLSSGKLFATGIDLLSGKSEGSYLLDQFAQNVQTDRFQPQNEIVPDDLKAILASLRKQWGKFITVSGAAFERGPEVKRRFLREEITWVLSSAFWEHLHLVSWVVSRK